MYYALIRVVNIRIKKLTKKRLSTCLLIKRTLEIQWTRLTLIQRTLSELNNVVNKIGIFIQDLKKLFKEQSTMVKLWGISFDDLEVRQELTSSLERLKASYADRQKILIITLFTVSVLTGSTRYSDTSSTCVIRV